MSCTRSMAYQIKIEKSDIATKYLIHDILWYFDSIFGCGFRSFGLSESQVKYKEVDQHSWTGLHAHSCTQLIRAHNSVSFSLIYRSYTGDALVNPNMRHLFVTKILTLHGQNYSRISPLFWWEIFCTGYVSGFSPPLYGITIYRKKFVVQWKPDNVGRGRSRAEWGGDERIFQFPVWGDIPGRLISHRSPSLPPPTPYMARKNASLHKSNNCGRRAQRAGAFPPAGP